LIVGARPKVGVVEPQVGGRFLAISQVLELVSPLLSVTVATSVLVAGPSARLPEVIETKVLVELRAEPFKLQLILH
jgi:hypothetical protein